VAMARHPAQSGRPPEGGLYIEKECPPGKVQAGLGAGGRAIFPWFGGRVFGVGWMFGTALM